ncbi:MAG: FG-GAP-like repeat-containing protein [Terracidiphilus sp.]
MNCLFRSVASRSSFAALMILGGSLASSLGLNAQIPTPPTPHARHRAARPMVSGADGTQTGTADFLGNFTTITTSSGAALALGRESDCTLTLATGSYTVTGSTLNYTETDLIPGYERVLHTEAQLTTTPDVFSTGCAIEPTAGFGSRPGVFVGMTTSGVYVYAGLGLIYPSLAEGIYLLTGTTNFSLSSFQDSTAGNLTAADLNKDGNGDLVILDGASATTGRVIVMLGNADGTFKNGVIYPIAGNYSVAAVIDDVNGDGKLDIVAVSGDQQISVLLGNGDGTFQAAQSFAAPSLPGYSSAASTPIVNLITADLRGIGKKDIIGSNGLVLLGNGNGTFTAVTAPAFPYFQDYLYAGGPNLSSGDLNKDGKIDVAVNNGSSISTWLGNGDGTFTQGQSYATINSDGFISISDLDGDGNADIFVGLGDGGVFAGDEGSPNLSYALMGNGNGTLQGAPQLLSGGYNGNNLVDLNGDGVPDLISSSSAGGLSVQLGNGKGAFAAGVNVPPPASFSLNGYNFTMGTSAEASSYAIGDVNGDGKPDLVFVDNSLTAVASGGSTPITYPYPVYFVALGNGDGTFQTPVPYAFPQIAPTADFDISNTVSNLEIADVNHDGNADLILAYNEIAGGTGVIPYNQGIVVLPGNGNGTFKAPVLTSTYSSASAPTSAFVPQIDNIGDLNGDGYPDLIVNSPGTTVVNFQLQTQLQAFLGNGDGTFKTPTTIAVGADAYDTVLEDLNKDGKLDLAVLAETSSSQAELVTLLGNGDGTFATAAVSNLTGGDAIRNANLAAADFDGNGTVDLALLDPEDFSGIFYGNGNGTFTSVNTGSFLVPKDLINIGSVALGAGTAVAVDLNKDGKPDILDGGMSLINVYGEAPATTATPTVTVTPSPSSITTAQSTAVTIAVGGGSGAATPTGSVILSSGAYTSTATTLTSGSALVTVPAGSLAAGTDTLAATYTPDSASSSIYNSAAGTSSITVTTAAATPSFALTNSGNVTLSPGATTGNTSAISVTPSGGFTGAVALTCAIAPTATSDPATCALSPASVTISGASVGTSTLTLTTTAATTADLDHRKPGGIPWFAGGGATLACLVFLMTPARKRRLRKLFGVIVLLAFMGAGLVSCGGGGGSGKTGNGGGGGTTNPGTTAGTYTVTVTGTAASTTSTTTVTLTVN